MGLCTIRFCRALLKGDGTLASPVMSWMDERVSRPYEHLNPEVRLRDDLIGIHHPPMTGQFKDTAANYAGVWPINSDTLAVAARRRGLWPTTTFAVRCSSTW